MSPPTTSTCPPSSGSRPSLPPPPPPPPSPPTTRRPPLLAPSVCAAPLNPPLPAAPRHLGIGGVAGPGAGGGSAVAPQASPPDRPRGAWGPLRRHDPPQAQRPPHGRPR